MTKILATIGPESDKIKDLLFILKKTDFVRLNGSHNTIIWHKKTVENLSKIKKEINILLDLPGIKPRTNNAKDIFISKNQEISFYYGNFRGKDKKIMSIQLTNKIPETKSKNKFFTISDGRYRFKILKANKNMLLARSVSSFNLKPKQGLNIPFSIFDERKQYEIYVNFLKNYLRKIKNISSIGLSYIQSENVIKKIKKKFPNLLVVSKIENYKGLQNIKKICEFSDGIMIDRGDLSAEIGEDKLYDAVINIIDNSKAFNIPVILATENLTSMLKNPSPSKSEIFSLDYLQALKIDRVMLSEETAISINWKIIINWLSKHLEKRKKSQIKKNEFLKTQNFWEIFNNIKNLRTVLFTKKGYAISKILENKEIKELIVFTDNQKLHKLNMIRDNLKSYLINKFNNEKLSEFIFKTIKKNKKAIFKDINDPVALIYISNPKKKSRANTLQFVFKEDFQ